MHDTSFFLSAFIYLTVAVVMVPLAHRLGLGSVLGYLIGGALIGPFGLGWVGGAEGEEALHFAEFGVVIMLFLIGLELEPARLWRLRGPVFGLGGAQVGLTTLVVMAVALAGGLAWKPALAIGLMLALSSTAIVIQTLQEKGLLRTDGGSDAFAILLFQDISVIPMLAVFPLLATAPMDAEAAHGLASMPAWLQPLITLGAVGAIVLGGQFLVPRLFHVLAKTGLRELLTAAALLLIIGVELLMTQVGLSPALGAFVAGVVLAGSHYRHELESNLEPFKGLLLGLFFLAVGASMDFGVLAARPVLVGLLVAGLIALKVGVLLLVTRWLRIQGQRRWLPALALAQGGEFAFALLSMALQQRLLDADLTKLLVAVVALSMAVTPLLFILYEKGLAPRFTSERAAPRDPDPVDQAAPVILAGFGRFGNFVGRFLLSQGVKVTVLETDPDHVEMLRSFGFKVFYGDATRTELLEAAGIADARLLIISLADRAKVARLVTELREQHPHVRLLARAHDYDHRFELMDLGLAPEDMVHELTHGALELGARALTALGRPPEAARRALQLWQRHDEETLHLLRPVQEDRAAYASIVRQRRIELEQLFQKDRDDPAATNPPGSDA